MKKHFSLSLFLYGWLALISIFLSNCSSNEVYTKASVETSEVSNITEATANCGGIITSNGGAAIIARGVCWSKFLNPTLNDSFTKDSVGSGTFRSKLDGLEAGTTYYVCSYASNKAGTSYGRQISFTTRSFSINTTTPFFVMATSAISGGTVVADGDSSNYTIKACGVCWNTFQNPTINNDTTLTSNKPGSFTSTITGLLPLTRYYVRSYVTNSLGTTYGNEESFLTQNGIISLVTGNPLNIKATSATFSGVFSGDGGSEVMELGFCWSSLINPTLVDPHVAYNEIASSINCNILGLMPNTTYHARAYGINDIGTSYGNDIFFTTLNGIISISTTVNTINATSAKILGNITNDGGSDVISKGFCWSKFSNPTITDTKIEYGGSVGAFSSTINNLELNKTYYVRSFAKNEVGTYYGNEATFTSKNGIIDISNNSISAITTTSAQISCKLNDDGGTSVLNRGICWSLNIKPTTDDEVIIDGSLSVNLWNQRINTLSPGTKYFLRAFATNIYGTYYGPEMSLSTVQNSTSDIDGNIYKVISIGDQVWMAEDLKTTRFRNGDIIPRKTRSDDWVNLVSGASGIGNSGAIHYNWYSINDSRGLAPTGWHVASASEWAKLANVSGGNLKESGDSNWKELTVGSGVNTSTNVFGFTALPNCIYCFFNPESIEVEPTTMGVWWSSSESIATKAYYLKMYTNENGVSTLSAGKYSMFPVRCVKDIN